MHISIANSYIYSNLLAYRTSTRKLVQLVLLILLVMFTDAALSQSDSKPDFSWSTASKYESFPKVRFETGDVAVVVSDQKPPPYQRVKEACSFSRLEIGKEQNRFVTDACDARVDIRAAYPSPTNAKVAIIETNCGGTICNSYNDIYIVFLTNEGIRITKVGTGFYGPKVKPTFYEFWFEGKSIKRSIIRNFFDGLNNEVGDPIESTRKFITPGAYIDVRFKKQYEKFVGEHPETFMGDSAARADLLKIIKPIEFKEYRNAMSGPGGSVVSNGRYVVMNACMAHNCDDVFATAVVDGFTGNAQLLRFDISKSIFVAVSTYVLNSDVDYKWLDDVNTQNYARLSIESGKLTASKQK